MLIDNKNLWKMLTIWTQFKFLLKGKELKLKKLQNTKYQNGILT